MIGKVMTGKSFGGCVRYTAGKKDAVILDAAGVRTGKVNQIVSDFNLQRKFNPDLGKAVGHIALSWSSKDLGKLSDEVMLNVAKQYLQKMGIQHTQYLVVKHQDRNHPHVHIVYNRVNNEGKTISDNFQKQRNAKVCLELSQQHGFYLSPGKEQVNREQLKGADKVKYELYDAIKAASRKASSIDELKFALAKQGIGLQYKYKSGSSGSEVQGISFSKDGYKFKGSEIDRSMSYGRLRGSIEERVNSVLQAQADSKDLAQQLREILKHQQPGQQTTYLKSREQTHYLKPQPETHYLKEAVSLGFELFGNLMENMPEEDEPLTPEQKKKKKQGEEQSKGISR